MIKNTIVTRIKLPHFVRVEFAQRVKDAGVTKSAFVRDALRAAVEHVDRDGKLVSAIPIREERERFIVQWNSLNSSTGRPNRVLAGDAYGYEWMSEFDEETANKMPLVFSFRISPELLTQVDACAERLKMKRSEFYRAAVMVDLRRRAAEDERREEQ